MKKPLEILLVEDDIDDIDLLKEALNDNEVKYQMEVIMEGDKVFNYLTNINTLPELIVMDLNLPKVGGKEILREIKKTSTFTAIPIIVLTTSSAKDDIEYCYNMGINKYITKPTSLEGWTHTINTIVDVAMDAGLAN